MKNIDKNVQTINQKRGEVAYRKLMSEQHSGTHVHFSTELNQSEMLSELEKRLASTDDDFIKLKKLDIPITPYLEIGAEYGLRSALLESKFSCHGVALDIARTPLEKTKLLAHQFKLTKIPIRICADAHALPYADNSFPFVFCYQTLHHFPNPLPVIKEIIRVLKPGGYFFFAEEPVRQDFNLRAFRRPTKTTGFAKLLKYLLVLPFISQIGKTEVEYGIVEETFPLYLWKKITDQFSIEFVEIKPFLIGPQTTIHSNSSFKTNFMTRIGIFFLGGGIKGLLKKPGTLTVKKVRSINFRCPTCTKKLLIKKHLFYNCNNCHSSYRIINGIIQLLPAQLDKVLYKNG